MVLPFMNYDYIGYDLHRMDMLTRTADWMTAKMSKGSRPKRRKNRLKVRRATRQRHKRGA